MKRPLGLNNRLTWQTGAPAPFESAWSVFTKILTTNYLTPVGLKKIIARRDHARIGLIPMYFRSSDWVDFDLFSAALNVTKPILETLFLDQLGCLTIQESYTDTPIKFCRQCLDLGFHSVFFELGFIQFCPWHGCLLFRCYGCYRSVARGGMTKKRNGRNPETDLDIAYTTSESCCGHIFFQSKSIGLMNKLTIAQEVAITEKSLELIGWIRKALSQPHVTSKLFRYKISDLSHVQLEELFGAAIEIAGPFPWISNIKPAQTRWLGWNPNEDSHLALTSVDHQLNTFLPNYKSIRRHIFNRYLKEHRQCHLFVKHLPRYDALALNSDGICPVALSFWIWRLLVELQVDISELKRSHIPWLNTNHAESIISSITNCMSEVSISSRGTANVLYARFFLIWAQIEKLSGNNSFEVSVRREDWKNDRLLYTNFQPGNQFENMYPCCTIIFNDPKLLIKRSDDKCMVGKMHRYWMLESHFDSSRFQSEIFIFKKPELGLSGTMFNSRKFENIYWPEKTIHIDA